MSNKMWVRFDKPGNRPTKSETPGAPRSSGRPWIVAVILGLLVSGGLAFVLIAGRGPDPHFVRARQMVEEYETGRRVEARNYGHAVYQQALDELAQVDPGSSSAELATAMAEELRTRVERFSAEQRAIEHARQQALQNKKNREATALNHREERRRDPRVEFTECEEENIKARRQPS